MPGTPSRRSNRKTTAAKTQRTEQAAAAPKTPKRAKPSKKLQFSDSDDPGTRPSSSMSSTSESSQVSLLPPSFVAEITRHLGETLPEEELARKLQDMDTRAQLRFTEMMDEDSDPYPRDTTSGGGPTPGGSRSGGGSSTPSNRKRTHESGGGSDVRQPKKPRQEPGTSQLPSWGETLLLEAKGDKMQEMVVGQLLASYSTLSPASQDFFQIISRSLPKDLPDKAKILSYCIKMYHQGVMSAQSDTLQVLSDNNVTISQNLKDHSTAMSKSLESSIMGLLEAKNSLDGMLKEVNELKLQLLAPTNHPVPEATPRPIAGANKYELLWHGFRLKFSPGMGFGMGPLPAVEKETFKAHLGRCKAKAAPRSVTEYVDEFGASALFQLSE